MYINILLYALYHRDQQALEVHRDQRVGWVHPDHREIPDLKVTRERKVTWENPEIRVGNSNIINNYTTVFHHVLD